MLLNTWKTLMLAAAICVVTGGAASAADCAALQGADGDGDGKLELPEVKKAAAAAWRKVAAMSGKAAEFETRLGSKELAGGDSGMGVSEKEYVEIATTMFRAADADKEGSVDCGELGAVEGQNLVKLLK